jgi:hypothetical protein
MKLSDPGQFRVVTPNDGANLTGPGVTRGICVSVGGTLKVTYSDGTTQSLTVPAGVLPMYGVVKVFATGTAATGISAIY